MSEILQQIQALVLRREVRISAHGYDELAADDIFVRDLFVGLTAAVVIEDYADYHKGPCVLVLQQDGLGNPIHAVWGLPKGATSPAVLVTAYRPDPDRWNDTFTKRKR